MFVIFLEGVDMESSCYTPLVGRRLIYYRQEKNKALSDECEKQKPSKSSSKKIVFRRFDTYFEYYNVPSEENLERYILSFEYKKSEVLVLPHVLYYLLQVVSLMGFLCLFLLLFVGGYIVGRWVLHY